MIKPRILFSPDGEGAGGGAEGDPPAVEVEGAGDQPEADAGDQGREKEKLVPVAELAAERKRRQKAEKELADAKRDRETADKTVEERLTAAERERDSLAREKRIGELVSDLASKLKGHTVDTAKVSRLAAKLNISDDDLEAEVESIVDDLKRPVAVRVQTPGNPNGEAQDRAAEKKPSEYTPGELTTLFRKDPEKARAVIAARAASLSFGGK